MSTIAKNPVENIEYEVPPVVVNAVKVESDEDGQTVG